MAEPPSTGPCRVLHVVLSLEPGGMENGVVNVANQLPRSEFQVGIACLEKVGAFGPRLAGDVPTWSLDKPPGKSWRTIVRLHRLLRAWRPDVVHTHNLGPLLYAAAASWWGRTASILHGEHAELTAEEQGPKRLRLRRRCYRAARIVHTVSSSLTRHLEGLPLQPRLLRTVRNGVDVWRFVPGARVAARQRFGIPGAGRVLGMVGRFGPFKRHRELIEAFERVAGRHPDWTLLIVGGGGPEEGRVRAQAAASPWATRIVVTGFQLDPVPAYQAMDALVVPSVNEGLSNAILEAMACGVPVLSHDACGADEVIDSGRNGWVEDLGSTDRLAARLDRLMGTPGLELVGGRARQKAEAELSLDAMVRAYADLYRVLRRGGAKG